jgi:hypothetical protein
MEYTMSDPETWWVYQLRGGDHWAPSAKPGAEWERRAVRDAIGG